MCTLEEQNCRCISSQIGTAVGTIGSAAGNCVGEMPPNGTRKQDIVISHDLFVVKSSRTTFPVGRTEPKYLRVSISSTLWRWSAYHDISAVEPHPAGGPMLLSAVAVRASWSL